MQAYVYIEFDVRKASHLASCVVRAAVSDDPGFVTALKGRFSHSLFTH